jgi:hypothetical protein
MTVAAVLQHVAGARARVSIENGYLRLRGPREALTPDLKREVAEHKAELLALLTAPDRVVRDRLRAIAEQDRDQVNPNVIERLSPDDLADCRTLADDTLHAYLIALTDTTERMKGKAPWSWTAPAMCAHCGPVWLHPAVVLALPIVNGLRTALGCPWCPEHADRRLFARPHVTCAGCARFAPNENNAHAGLGHCAAKDNGQWPLAKHACGHFQPINEAVNVSSVSDHDPDTAPPRSKRSGSGQ